MTRTFNFKTVIAVAAVVLMVGFAAGGGLNRYFAQPTLTQNAYAAAPDVRGLPDFVSLAKKLTPVVVNVSTTQSAGNQSPSASQPSPFSRRGPRGGQGQGQDEDPFGDFWRRFFGNPPGGGGGGGGRGFRQQSLGSGFIIDRDGTILTNNHVVDNGSKITVKLQDGREFDAKVLGKDAKTDIAIIKIDAKGDLPVAALGDSDKLEVGEWVVAIGNPFGLESTVTSGIVSAKGRHIGAGPYDNFIQTDASINPGNSGGPLINLRGEVVGINTAIFSQSGGNIGIGFATPINSAKDIIPELKSKGKVTRGWLGVSIQNVTPDIASSLGLEKSRGALVADVLKEGPAERAGLKVGDVIVDFDGQEIKESSDLPSIVARTRPGKQVNVKVLRDKKETTVPVTITELKEEEVVASAKEKGDLGLTVQKVTPEMADNLQLGRATGVVITAVESGSAAEEAGLQQGDVIVEVDRKPVRDIPDFRKAVSGAKKGQRILFLVRREGNSLFVALRK
ncbi:MAG TPA: DegQ family serine endoprotease [Candidatus Binatia bacterium]|jgi:serine protease Do